MVMSSFCTETWVRAKTTFAQGIARGLGIAGPIQSPTFTVIAEYEPGDRRLALVHIDLYRLEGGPQLESIGLDDVIDRDGSVTIIEWPERMVHELGLRVWNVRITLGEGDERTIEGHLANA